jgi:hypothetical protein
MSLFKPAQWVLWALLAYSEGVGLGLKQGYPPFW